MSPPHPVTPLPPMHTRELAPADLNHHRPLRPDAGVVAFDLCAFDAHTAAVDQPACLAFAARQAGRDHEIDDVHGRINRELWYVGGQLAALELALERLL